MWRVFMAFLNFTTKEEFMAIVYSANDTVRLTNSKDSPSEISLIESFGFERIERGSIEHAISLHGITYRFIDETTDTTIYISFSNPVKLYTGISYMLNKHFFSTSKKVYHRENSQPAFISYHGSGKPHIQNYAIYGKTPPITIIDDKEYSYLTTVTSTRTTKDYLFEKQKWHATQYRFNNKSMSPLQVTYYNDKFPTSFIEFHALKRLYPDLARLVGYDRINLNKSLTPEEITLLEMMMF
jgi:hypothetical protein